MPEDEEKRIIEIESILAKQRSKTFPVHGFQKHSPDAWSPPNKALWAQLNAYFEERGKIDNETRRLTALFRETLRLPFVSALKEAENCPLCGTQDALTTERIAYIKERFKETEDYQHAEADASRVLRQMESSAHTLSTMAESSLPQFLQWGHTVRHKEGFTGQRIRTLLGDDANTLGPPWLATIRPLKRAAAQMEKAANETVQLVVQYLRDLTKLQDTQPLKNAFSRLAEAKDAFLTAYKAYESQENLLTEHLNAVLDEKSETAGWQDFISLAHNQTALHSAIIERKARETVLKELKKAVKEIDKAKEKVLDDKFADLSESVQEWWELLRPDEPTFFSALGPRPGARRTIDIKAGLSPHPDDRSGAKIRDVVAIFSQSQLHCLGLALFLARAEHEKTGFVVLDDPIFSSDEDYRAHFNASVVEKLLSLPTCSRVSRLWFEVGIQI